MVYSILNYYYIHHSHFNIFHITFIGMENISILYKDNLVKALLSLYIIFLINIKRPNRSILGEEESSI